MRGQVFIRFPKEMTRFLTGDYEASEEIVLPLFRELLAEEELVVRRHARENYQPGDPINEVYHPVWRDEAQKMNDELRGSAT